MDAYSNYILKMSNARLAELRGEAAEHAMSRAARRARPSWRRRARRRLPDVFAEPLGSPLPPEALDRI